MAEISKGKRSDCRRSSILKTALADIDVNVRERKPEFTKSKRVSFAETCCIKEFPRDSPQILKAAEHNDSADTSADSSLQDSVTVPSTDGPSNAEVDQPLQSNAAAGSCFMLDDGESTFITDMANHGGFRESTRRFDRLDSCMFGEAGGLDMSEITQRENSVFGSAPSTRPHSMAAGIATMPSGSMYPGGKTAIEISQAQSQPSDRPAQKQTSLKRAPELNFHSQGNRTLLFDNQDGGTMDLTDVNNTRGDFTFQNSPKISARDFLNKMKRGMMGSGCRQEKEQQQQQQHTIMFSDTCADENAMELTQNLTVHNVTSDFKLVPQAFNPLAPLEDTETVSGTRNSSDLNPDDVPKVSAKFFLASLRQTGPMLAGATAAGSTALVNPGVEDPVSNADENEQGEDGDVTMELTCQLANKPISQVASTSSAFQHMQSVTQKYPLGLASDAVENDENGAEAMELTACMNNTYRMSVQPSGLTSFSAETQVCLSGKQEINTSSGQTRNALMDITARHSISPPSVGQPSVDKENVCFSASTNQNMPGTPTTNVIVVEQAFIEREQACQINSNMPSGHALSVQKSCNQNALFTDQENIDSNCKIAAGVNQHSSKVPLRPVQTDGSAPLVTIPVTCPMNVSVSMSGGQYPLSSADPVNHSVHFASGDDMEITQDFGPSLPHPNADIASQGIPSLSQSVRSMHAVDTSGRPSVHEAPVYGENKAKHTTLPAKGENSFKKESHEKTVAFNKDDTAADMSLTCITFPRAALQEKSATNRTVMFDKGDAVGDMSLTCAVSEPLGSVDKSSMHRTVVYGEETVANMSLTCTNLSTKVAVDGNVMNRSTAFQSEEFRVDMSMTCADLERTENVNFKTDNMVADMSLTCADLSQIQQNRTGGQTKERPSTDMREVLEKSVVFAKETTAANMSLTCADLTLTHSIEQKKLQCDEESKTITFKQDSGDEQTRALVPGKHHSWEKSMVFSGDASTANMSLTCANLPMVGTVEQEEAANLDKRQRVTSRSDSTEFTESRDGILSEKCRPSERTVVFSHEATSANMSLTCAELPAADNTDRKMPGHSEESRVRKENGDKTKIFCHDSSMNVMDMTCLSSMAKSEDVMNESTKQESVVPSHDKPQTQVDRTLSPVKGSAETQNISASAKTNGVSGHSQYLVAETEEEAEEGFFKREPTTLMDITRVLENLGKQINQGEPLDGAEPEKATSQEEHKVQDLSPSEQPKQENKSSVSSRKLQLTHTPETRLAHIPDSHTESRQSSVLVSNSLKRSLSDSNRESEPILKTVRLCDQLGSDTRNGCSSVDSKDSDIFREPEPKGFAVEDKNDKVDFLSTGKQLTDTLTHILKPSSSSSSSSNSSSHSGRSIDIISETMPVFGLSASNISWASSSAMSMSAIHNATGSFLSSGRSFVEKQEKGEEDSSFLQACERLGLTQSDLRGWVCRRSSVAVRQEVSCDTLEDQLNSASVVKQECESKLEFISAMEALQQREAASTEELEKRVMEHISQNGLVAEAEQSQPLRQQIRGLLFASRKHAQVLWKTQKAERLNTFAEKLEKYSQAVSTDLENMMAGIEEMSTLKDNIDSCIEQYESEVKSLQTQVSTKGNGSEYERKQQELQQQQSDLAALQKQVSEAEQMLKQMKQKEQALLMEKERAAEQLQVIAQQQKQLAQAQETLAALHCVHCWRAVRVEAQQVDFLLLYDAVLLSVKMAGSSPHQSITHITVTSRLREGTEPWAMLATELVVDSLSASSQHLMDTFPTREHLPLLLNEVTSRVEDIKTLCMQIKIAAIHHPITITAKQVAVSLWSTEKLRKVVLTTDVPAQGYPKNPLSWGTQVVMGDISDQQLQAAISQVEADRKHFTDVLQTVHSLLHQ